MSEAKCPECDLAQHRGDCFDDEIDARLSKSLRAEGERLRAHGGGSITYVERCDSCETFRQRMIAEKARAEKAEAEVERLRKLLSLDPNGAELARIYDGWTESMARAEKAERERVIEEAFVRGASWAYGELTGAIIVPASFEQKAVEEAKVNG